MDYKLEIRIEKQLRYRTGRAVGAAGQLKVLVNSKDAGGTGPGTFFRWDLLPGTYTFASSTGESSAVVQLEVKEVSSCKLQVSSYVPE